LQINKKKKSLSSPEFSAYQKICPQTEIVYLDILRKMTGERKLKIAFQLYEMALSLCRQSIREKNPDIKDKELNRILFKRFGYDPGRPADKSH
jgi:hypothetical protein